MYQASPPLPPQQVLPTMYDLPSGNPEEPGLPDEFHLLQPDGLMMNEYQPLELDEMGVWLKEAELGLGRWQGVYQGVERQWLRWYDGDRRWLPTPTELEAQRADQEAQRADRLAARLRELGVDPDGV